MMNQAGHTGRCKGFSLVELIIVVSVLGILAAMVIPKFVNASDTARSSAMLDTLRGTRMALERYKFDHDDTYPDIDDLWGALISKSDRDGTLNAAGDYGPYLKMEPTNPFTNSSSVTTFGEGKATDGWEYDVTEQPVLIGVGFNETTGEYTAP